jgi:hypothetical protein
MSNCLLHEHVATSSPGRLQAQPAQRAGCNLPVEQVTSCSPGRHGFHRLMPTDETIDLVRKSLFIIELVIF